MRVIIAAGVIISFGIGALIGATFPPSKNEEDKQLKIYQSQTIGYGYTYMGRHARIISRYGNNVVYVGCDDERSYFDPLTAELGTDNFVLSVNKCEEDK